jgi:hypothetical protein
MPCCERSARSLVVTADVMSEPTCAAASTKNESRRTSAPRTRRLGLRCRQGYALIVVTVSTLLIVVASVIALALARESGIAAIAETRTASAYSAATTGVQWMLANLSSPSGKATCLAAAVARPGTPTSTRSGDKRIYRFDPEGRFAGIPSAPPPPGTSTQDWTALGHAHYALLAATDPLDPVNSVLVRSMGIDGTAQVVLETNVSVSPVQSLPSGLTGCFPASFQMSLRQEEGPVDYAGRFRLDGTLGFPLALSAEHNRVNGLARLPDAPVTVLVDPDDKQGVRWRGQQNLRALVPAAGVENIFGGTRTRNFVSDGAEPQAGWLYNPFLSNDPRIVDVFELTNMRGLGLGAGGGLFSGAPGAVFDTTSPGVTNPRGLPLVAFASAPAASATTTAQGGFLAQSAWATAGDDVARRGFYGCSNLGGADGTLNDATNVCLVGTTSDTGSPDWSAASVLQSGRAWAVLQAVVRQCTGSGSSINVVDGTPWWHPTRNPNGVRCANGFEWLENVAACLVVPRAAALAAGRATHALRDDNPYSVHEEFDDGDDNNNLAGCHPACVVATDVNGDGDIDDDDRPFRSVCLNLDAARVATYGPGMLVTRLQSTPGDVSSAAFANTVETNDAAIATTPVDRRNRTSMRWTAYNETTPAAPDVHDTSETKATRFKGRDGVVRIGGVVQERGNPALIARLDMSDRGPLGTCEQNCLAYGFGKDRTYGAHRSLTTTHADLAPHEAPPSEVVLGSQSRGGSKNDPHCVAEVPSHTSAGTPVLQHCNWDADDDGFLDRVSFALHSAYREECVGRHDGIAWAPAFDVSSNNDALAQGGGCTNDLPARHPDTAPAVVTPFCEDGSESALRAEVDRLAVAAQSVRPSALNNTTGRLTAGDGWWGGASCHMGQGVTFDGRPHDSMTPHIGSLRGLREDDTDAQGRPDYWIEDECPTPVVLKVDSSANLNIGKVCGCGILMLSGQSLNLGSDSHLLWRGLVVWTLKESGRQLKLSGNLDSTLIVDGGLLVLGTKGMQIVVEKSDLKKSGSGLIISPLSVAKQMYRYNPRALTDAFAVLPRPLRAMRRVR